MPRGSTTCTAAIQFAMVYIVAAIIGVSSDDTTPIPASNSAVNHWFQNNVKPYTSRKGSLNASLLAAEANPKIIRVRKDGSGNFKTVSDAINSIPSGNKQRVIVNIGGGVYNEKITIDRSKGFVTLYGSPNNMPVLQFGGTAKQYGTVYSATLTVMSDFFVAANLIIKNAAPMPSGKTQMGEQAVALRTGGDKAAVYNCKIYGFQDTLCDDKGRHFFKDCYIQGTVDFIFGSGKSIYLNTELRVVGGEGLRVITAQARNYGWEDTGFSFVHCKVTGNGKASALLGRAWMKMPKVLFAFTDMAPIVDPVGWSTNFHPERQRTVSFSEYKCTGAGSNPNGRAKFSKQLTEEEARSSISLGYIQGSNWLLPPPTL